MSGAAREPATRAERALLVLLSLALLATAGLAFDLARHGGFLRADAAPWWIAAGLTAVAGGSLLFRPREATLPRVLIVVASLGLGWATPLAHRRHVAQLRAAAEGPARAALMNRQAPRLEWAHALHPPEAGEAGLGRMSGRFTLVDFWATWCAPCRVHMPRLEELHRQVPSDTLRVLGVTMLYGDASPEGVRRELQNIEAFLAELGVSYPVVVAADDANHRRYHADSLPSAVLIDRDGRVIDYGVGIVGTEAVFEHARQLVGED